MKNRVLVTLVFISFLLSLGQMPKGWDRPSLSENETKNIIGSWSIDIEKIIEEYRKTPEYKEAGEFAEMGVGMIEEIFSSMKFIFNNDQTYELVGVPNPNGGIEDFKGTWSNDNEFIILKSPQDNNQEDLVFKLSGNDFLIPQNKNAQMFYLIREK